MEKKETRGVNLENVIKLLKWMADEKEKGIGILQDIQKEIKQNGDIKHMEPNTIRLDGCSRVFPEINDGSSK